VFDIVPTFSFDSTDLDEMNEEKEGKTEDIQERMIKVEGKLVSLKSKLTRPFLDIDASYSVLSADVHKLYDKIKLLTIAIGPVQRLDSINMSVKGISSKVALLEEFKSDALTRFSRITSNLEEFQDNVNGTMEELSELQAAQSQFSNWMSNADKLLTTYGKRFAAIKPIIQKMSSSNSVLQEDSFLESFKVSSTVPLRSETCGDQEAMVRRIADLEEKIKLLENRVVGAGVQMGSFVFQSFDDLVKWVQTKVPKGRFGLFVDGHSFLKFFTLSGRSCGHRGRNRGV
jgi:chromosome segregation ATPase